MLQHHNDELNGHGDHHRPEDRHRFKTHHNPFCKKNHHQDLVTPWDPSVDHWYHEEIQKVLVINLRLHVSTKRNFDFKISGGT